MHRNTRQGHLPRLVILLTVIGLAVPADLPAGRGGYGPGMQARYQPDAHAGGLRSRLKLPARLPPGDMRSRLKLPARVPGQPGTPGRPVHPIYPGQKPCRPDDYPCRRGYWWPVGTTIERAPQPIVIVTPPPPAETPPPPPEPQKVWVPPIMGTRTEPGYWDYGVKKRWMGDHWRFEQDFDSPTWVPATEVEYVKQEGYWKIAE